MILPKTVQIYQKTINSQQDKTATLRKTANCRYTFEDSTIYSQTGDEIELKGYLHVNTDVTENDLVSFDGVSLYELANIKKTVDLNNNLLFCFANLRKTYYEL